MTEIVIEAHRRKIPIDHPDRSITREKLEYPTEDVSFAYLHAIGKLTPSVTYRYGYAGIATVDAFTDKAISCIMETGEWDILNNALNARIANPSTFDNLYACGFDTSESTADFRIDKIVNGTATHLAHEAVDLGNGYPYWVTFSVVGSTLKGWRQKVRDLTVSATVSVTDTDLASGHFGVGGVRQSYAELLAPASPLPKALAIIECNVVGSGNLEDPIRPNLAQDLRDEKDLLSVTWGAFDHKKEHSTILIIVTGENSYTGEKAILEQIEQAKSKNLKVLKPPRDYKEAVEQYRMLKKDFPEWLAGKENYTYQCGFDIEPLAIADFYYGELIEHKTHYKQLKRVPDWEMRKTLSMWKERLKKVSALVEERDKHLKKLEKVEKIGW